MDEIRNTLAHAGLDDDDPIEYNSDDVFWHEMVIPVLELLPRKELSERLGVSTRTLERWISGEVKPDSDRRVKVINRLDNMLSEILIQFGIEPQDTTTNFGMFPVWLENRRNLIQQTLIKLVQQHGQRKAARMLNIPQVTLRIYQNGGLPVEVYRVVEVAEQIVRIIYELPPLNETVSTWETLNDGIVVAVRHV